MNLEGRQLAATLAHLRRIVPSCTMNNLSAMAQAPKRRPLTRAEIYVSELFGPEAKHGRN